MGITGQANSEKGRRFIFLFLCVSTLALFSACSHRTTTPGLSLEKQVLLKDVDPIDASAFIGRNRGNSNLVILDLRTPEEFRRRHIRGAINIDYYSDGFRQALAGLDRNKTYVLYCKTGRRSSETFEIMKSMGFKSAYHISGGIERWLADELPIEYPKNTPSGE